MRVLVSRDVDPEQGSEVWRGVAGWLFRVSDDEDPLGWATACAGHDRAPVSATNASALRVPVGLSTALMMGWQRRLGPLSTTLGWYAQSRENLGQIDTVVMVAAVMLAAFDCGLADSYV